MAKTWDKFSDFLSRTFYEEESEPPKEVEQMEEEVETPQLSQEEMAMFEVSISEESGENVTEMAQNIIRESQIESDNDEFPDICNVQTVLDTAGVNAEHELVRKILMNFVKCDPADLEKDGTKRRQLILDAIEHTKQQAASLKAEKARDEEFLIQAEKDAEVACTEAISLANTESEKAIEEEKARSAAIIAEIRQRTDTATEEAKRQREAKLESIAIQRTENETTLQKSANLVAETEKHGQTVISQIDMWLSYLK